MQQVNANTDEVNGDGLDRLERNVHAILIDAHKLSRGLKKTFEGISIIFDSLGINNEGLLMPTSLAPSASSVGTADTANTAASGNDAQTTIEVSGGKKLNEAEQSENSGTLEAVEQVEQPAQVKEVAQAAQAAQAEGTEETPEVSEVSEVSEANSSITYDDITKIIVEKIKQDTANNKKIEAIVNNYGVSMVSQLPKSKYEAFMAELASL